MRDALLWKPDNRTCGSGAVPRRAGSRSRQGARCRRADRAAAPPGAGLRTRGGTGGERLRQVRRPPESGGEGRGGLPGPPLRNRRVRPAPLRRAVPRGRGPALPRGEALPFLTARPPGAGREQERSLRTPVKPGLLQRSREFA